MLLAASNYETQRPGVQRLQEKVKVALFPSLGLPAVWVKHQMCSHRSTSELHMLLAALGKGAVAGHLAAS